MTATLISMLPTLALLLGTFVIGRLAFGAQARLEGYSFTEQALTKDNPAVLIRLAGMLTALFIAVFMSYQPSGYDAWIDLSNGTAAFAGGLAALIVSRYVNDIAILTEVHNNAAVVEDRNVAVAIVEASTFLATAIIFAGGMADQSHGFVFNVVWFAIGQIFLVGLAFAYQTLAPKIFSGVARGNAACALELAGILLSGGIAVGYAIRGEFVSWLSDLLQIAGALATWVVLMVIVMIVKRFVLVGNGRLTSELVEDRNWALGLVDGLIYVAFTAAFVSIHG